MLSAQAEDYSLHYVTPGATVVKCYQFYCVWESEPCGGRDAAIRWRRSRDSHPWSFGDEVHSQKRISYVIASGGLKMVSFDHSWSQAMDLAETRHEILDFQNWNELKFLLRVYKETIGSHLKKWNSVAMFEVCHALRLPCDCQTENTYWSLKRKVIQIMDGTANAEGDFQGRSGVLVERLRP